MRCFRKVEVPLFVLNILLDCYHYVIDSDPTKASLEKSFGFVAPKPKSNPIQHVIEKSDNDRYLAQQICIRRFEAWSKGGKLKLVQAFANVAAEENVRSETVRRAWHTHRSYYKKLRHCMKLPAKKIR